MARGHAPGTDPTPAMPPSALVLGRRLLHSSLLEALAYPHGVDRYVELVRPLLLARDVRAEVTAVRRQTPKSVTLTLRPNENWRGLRAGQFVGVSVEIDGVRLTRPYSPAGSAARPRERARADRLHPPARAGSRGTCASTRGRG